MYNALLDGSVKVGSVEDQMAATKKEVEMMTRNFVDMKKLFMDTI